MWIKALRISDFRNYEHLEIELADGLNFFVGRNGSGKTSVLEAVSYLAVARSLRGAGDAEVIRWGRQESGVSGDIVSEGSSHTTTLRFGRGGRKDVTVGGEKLPRLSDLVGMLRVAWFCPEDTWLTKGGPGERRKFLDLTLCQLDAGYLAALTGYRRALRQRNEALMSWSPDEDGERLLGVWTERLVACGGRVIAARHELMAPLSEAVSSFHSRITGSRALNVRYRGSVPGDMEAGARSVDEVGRRAALEARARELFTEALDRAAADERRRGFTLVGPHRDDLEVALDERLLRTFGSQGQHRTAAIALKLGQAAVLDADGRGVVVLLDDIMSELDDARVESLIDLVGRLGQALMTSTRSAPGGEARSGSRTFRVEAGRATRA
ncbi:MAG: DNA replication/repair protein RecF [Candidatus Eisenbacteria bacterium]|nr:DNA replication/repair protein RecF [Candidatus Eisenbacteria bacterium]